MSETLTRTTTETDLAATMAEIGRRARDVAAALALIPAEAKVKALRAAAAAVRSQANEILAANAEDVAEAKAAGIGAALVDRLALDPKRLEAVARGLEDIAALPDPIGRVLADWTRPNGLKISRVSVPLGVIGIIYESRPNVTADAGAIALKSGNAAILRGGSESFHSSRALVAALRQGLNAADLPQDAIQLVPTRAPIRRRGTFHWCARSGPTSRRWPPPRRRATAPAGWSPNWRRRASRRMPGAIC